MNIAVCDDSRYERELLLPMLREYLADKNIEAEILEYESGEELSADFAAGRFGLIFLDIYMAGATGIDTARLIKTVDPECVVIFTTTSLEHGADAFDVEAFHYIVKPVERKKLYTVLDKWYDGVCAVKTIEIKRGRKSRSVYIRDILYIDVLGRNCTVHTASERIETVIPLAAMEEALPEGEFCRPIRYCLAAMRHIQAIRDEDMLLDDGEKLPISRLERESLRRQLAKYRLKALRGR